jgi:NAD-dependent SIR2 family protein deacetylase
MTFALYWFSEIQGLHVWRSRSSFWLWPHCECGNPLRPSVVQFGEPIDPNVLSKAFGASRRAELFFVIGTSGVVSPAAQMPLMALQNGAKVIEITFDYRYRFELDAKDRFLTALREQFNLGVK